MFPTPNDKIETSYNVSEIQNNLAYMFMFRSYNQFDINMKFGKISL